MPRQRWVRPPPEQWVITTVPAVECPTASQSGPALTQAKNAATRLSANSTASPRTGSAADG